MRIRGRFVPIFASGNLVGRVAFGQLFVENLTVFALKFSRFDSAETNVELLAIGRVNVLRVNHFLACGVFNLFFWARKAVFQLSLLLLAVLALCKFGPNTSSACLVEVKSTLAFGFSVLAVDAIVENIADGFVRM